MMFPASVVGSLPRPPEVLKLLDEPHGPGMDEAIRGAIAMQEKAGLDVITDGEWRRRSYIGVIAELAHGFALETNPLDGRPWTVVTERLSPKEAGFIAREAEFLKKNSSVSTKVASGYGTRCAHATRTRSATTSCATAWRPCVAKSS
jgi:5-methyltetrahydropteroyltriglutamate--homocysteine methyltransferase